MYVPHLHLPLPRGVLIDIACHGSPSSPVLSGSLGVQEGETSPLDDVVTPLHSWSPSSSFVIHHALDLVALQKIVPHNGPKMQ